MKTIKKMNLLGISAALLVSSLFVSTKSEAVPAFARQTGMECNACHFQSYPALNSFGRFFRAQGYTMQGSGPLLTGEDLSLPKTLNASVITKIRYHTTNSDTANRGEIQWPDEAALLVGGRASENVGFLMELGLGPQEGEGTVTETGVAGTKQTVKSDVTGNFLSTKFHFNISDTFAIIPFSTDGLGAGYGFELLNTGVQRSQRPIENRKGMSAYQKLGTASGGATGVAAVYHTNDLFVNYSHWSPSFGNKHTKIGDMAHYIRVGYMPTIAGYDMGFGFTNTSGKVNDTGGDVASTGFDFQMQGDLAGKPTGIYASYVTVPKSSHYNSNTKDANSLAVLGKVGVMGGNKLQALAALNSYDTGTGSSETDTTIGVQYMLAQNVKLELNVVSSSKSANDYTQFMLFAGF